MRSAGERRDAWSCVAKIRMRRPSVSESETKSAHVGMLTFVQRSDSALRLNPHLHTLMLDGVYVASPHGLRFEPIGNAMSALFVKLIC